MLEQDSEKHQYALKFNVILDMFFFCSVTDIKESDMFVSCHTVQGQKRRAEGLFEFSS
jgi:hypothetical protein